MPSSTFEMTRRYNSNEDNKGAIALLARTGFIQKVEVFAGGDYTIIQPASCLLRLVANS